MNDFEKQLKTLRDLRMNDSEKSALRVALAHTMRANPLPEKSRSYPIRSPYTIATHPFMLRALALGLILLVAGGSSLTIASAHALPGDILYPVKIHIKEPIETKFAGSSEKKILVQKEHIENRIAEIKTLKSQGAISKQQVAEVKEAFVDHAKEIGDTITELKAEGKQDVVLAVTTDLLPTLKEFNTEQRTLAATASAGATEETSLPAGTTATAPAETNPAVPAPTESTPAVAPQTKEISPRVPQFEVNSTSTVPSAVETVKIDTVPAPAISATSTQNIVPEQKPEAIDTKALLDLTDTVQTTVTNMEAEQKSALAAVAVQKADALSGKNSDGTLVVPKESAGTPAPDVSAKKAPSETKILKEKAGVAPVKNPAKNVIAQKSSSGVVPATEAPRAVAHVFGKVSVGPICPVESADAPCAIPESAYTSRTIIAYPIKNSKKIIAQVHVGADGTYALTLPAPDTYIIDMTQNGIDSSKDIPYKITVKDGDSIEHAISIDTGIR